ncbi:hypothetical protein ACOSQ2_002025 [Xanthoceras sorbifolium]
MHMNEATFSSILRAFTIWAELDLRIVQVQSTRAINTWINQVSITLKKRVNYIERNRPLLKFNQLQVDLILSFIDKHLPAFSKIWSNITVDQGRSLSKNQKVD